MRYYITLKDVSHIKAYSKRYYKVLKRYIIKCTTTFISTLPNIDVIYIKLKVIVFTWM